MTSGGVDYTDKNGDALAKRGKPTAVHQGESAPAAEEKATAEKQQDD